VLLYVKSYSVLPAQLGTTIVSTKTYKSQLVAMSLGKYSIKSKCYGRNKVQPSAAGILPAAVTTTAGALEVPDAAGGVIVPKVN
jgi:hypothetical protein